MTHRSLIVVAVTLALACPGAAIAADTTKLVRQLGNLIGSEKTCDLRFDMDAVRAFIEKNVRADDLDFSYRLDSEVWLVESSAKRMEGARLAAHCFQIKRNAEALGLLAK